MWLKRFLDELLGPPKSDVLNPSPRVTPDPQHAAGLSRRISELAYSPEQAPFHRDITQEKFV